MVAYSKLFDKFDLYHVYLSYKCNIHHLKLNANIKIPTAATAHQYG